MRVIPLPPAFVAYLKEDGVVLPPSPSSLIEKSVPFKNVERNEKFEDEARDPSLDWPEFHQALRDAISELGGNVHPKLNWSAPKDATWITASKSMECSTPNEVYLLMKSSDFITHDIDHAFDNCVEDDAFLNDNVNNNHDQMLFYMALRKTIPSFAVSLEFRCFVAGRELIGVSQRDTNFYEFLFDLVPLLRTLIVEFYDRNLKYSFPDASFVFDVYVPQPKERGRVWLIDINPWARTTDSILFDWEQLERTAEERSLEQGRTISDKVPKTENEMCFSPIFRVFSRENSSTYSLNAPAYSFNRVPKDVIDANFKGADGIAEFIRNANTIESGSEDGLS